MITKHNVPNFIKKDYNKNHDVPNLLDATWSHPSPLKKLQITRNTRSIERQYFTKSQCCFIPHDYFPQLTFMSWLAWPIKSTLLSPVRFLQPKKIEDNVKLMMKLYTDNQRDQNLDITKLLQNESNKITLKFSMFNLIIELNLYEIWQNMNLMEDSTIPLLRLGGTCKKQFVMDPLIHSKLKL